MSKAKVQGALELKPKVVEASTGREAVHLAHKLRPDVVVMDIAMPELNGLEATYQIKKRFPHVKVLILSVYANEEYIFQTLRAGASGYLVKKAAPMELISAIQAAWRNESFLSPSISKKLIEEYIKNASQTNGIADSYVQLTSREREVLQLIAEGRKNREIADRLCISIKTVQTHKSHLMEKLNLNTIAELTQYAMHKGLITIPDSP